MSGLVFEYCSDNFELWREDTPNIEVVDPIGPDCGELKVIRGKKVCRSFYRDSPHLITDDFKMHINECDDITGFRLVLDL